MNLFGLMETSGSAMQAERMRAEVVAANMANAETTHTATGGPYRRQHVVFMANQSAAATGFANSFSQAATLGSTPMVQTGNLGQPLPFLNSSGKSEPAGGVHISAVVQDPGQPLK